MDKHHAGTVEVGATVVVIKKGDKEEKTFTLVGSEEANSLEGKISNESPLGQALIGKKAGDTATVIAPKGEVVYTIKKIA
jgi:transcription elongation factor GreA